MGVLTRNGRKGCGPGDVPQHGLQPLPGRDRVAAGSCDFLGVSGTGVDLGELFQRLGLGEQSQDERSKGVPPQRQPQVFGEGH